MRRSNAGTILSERLKALSTRAESGCLEWIGYIDHKGYGKMNITIEPKVVKCRFAHRLAYESWIGPIPDNLPLDHLCRNRRCIEPSHLEAVSTRENLARGVGPWHAYARRGICLRGHVRQGTKNGSCRDCRHLKWRLKHHPPALSPI